MPKPTFINLQKNKKNKILAVALNEFALNDYDHASITRIVKVLEIAKGSVYQYFENKKDLYLYLVEQATRKRQEYVKPLLKNPPNDFYELITQLFKETIQFDIENPLYSRLLSNANNEKFSKDLGNAMLEVRKKSMDFMRGLIEREVLMGSVRFDLNIDLASYLLAQMNAIIHPRVKTHFIKWAKKQNASYLIKEVAILFENGGYKACNYIVTVIAPEKERIKRIIARDNTSIKNIRAILNNQWKDNEKVKLSHFIIENITLSKTEKQVKKIHQKILKLIDES